MITRTWTTEQLCELLQCTRWTVYELRRQKRIIPLAVPSKPLTFPDSEVQRLLAVRDRKPVDAY